MVTEWSRGAETNFLVTSVEKVVSWGRKHSLWPHPFGTGCCAVEFMATKASDYDLARLGVELARSSPRQADLLLILGTVTCKQAPIIRQIYEQMPDPKWVIAVGVCASSGGFYRNYNTIQGADAIVPVDVYIPGCPPRPESILEAILQLQERITSEGFARDRGDATGALRPQQEAEASGGRAPVAEREEPEPGQATALSGEAQAGAS